MKDASLIMGYVDDQGEHCSDQHGTSPFSHSPDTDLGGQDDFTGASVVEEDGTTTLSFTLPREPADSLDPELVPGEPIRILAAYGDRDAFSGMHREAHSAEIEL